MNKARIKLIAYWVITALVAANYAFAGVVYIMQTPEVVEGMTKLGYPPYFIRMLGVWKLLGAAALIAPGLALVKEWAYAGMAINVIGASVSTFVSGMEIQHAITPIVMLVLIVASWALRPPHRRLAGTGGA